MILKEPNKTKSLCVRLTETEYRKLRKASEENDCKVTDIVRSAITKFLINLNSK